MKITIEVYRDDLQAPLAREPIESISAWDFWSLPTELINKADDIVFVDSNGERKMLKQKRREPSF